MKNVINKGPKVMGLVLFIVLLLVITTYPAAMQAESGLELAWGSYGGARGISSGGGYEMRGSSGWLLPETVSGANYTLSTFLNIEVPDPEQYTLVITVEGNGSTDPAEGTHTYAEGEEVTVTATPDEGWQFVQWSGDASGTSPVTTLTMDADITVTAVFEEIPDVPPGTDANLYWQHTDGRLKIWHMDGEERVTYDIFASVDPGWQAKALADMDGDGHPDIYWLHEDGRLKVWLMDGLEHIDTVYPLNPATGEPEILPVWDMMAVADLNDSGSPDIIWQALEGSREGDLAIWLMDGLEADRYGKLFNHPGDASVSPLWEIGAVFDLLGDGQPEVLWQSVSGEAFDQLAYWQLDVEGDEFTRSASARLTHVGDRAAIRSQWRMKAAVDLMGNGQHEIIFQGIAGDVENRVSYWVMDGPARVGGGRLDPDSVSPGWSLFGASN